MDVDHALRTTRSVRRRLDLEREIDPRVIEECIDVATQAPTGVNREGWRFLVVSDPERKAEIARLYLRAFDSYAQVRETPARSTYRQLAENLAHMPLLIVVCIEGRPPEGVARQVAFYGSVLPAAWSLMVALRARGLGATWTSLHLTHEQEAAQVLGIPADVTQTVLLPVAYTAGAVLKPADRKPAREVTYWNRWGERGSGAPEED